jgi:glycosyltransferase 2 family protein
VRSILITLCKYGLAFALLAFVIAQNWDDKLGPNGSDGSPTVDPGLRRILETGTVQWLPVGIVVSIVTVSLLLSFYRWYLLVRAQDLPFTKTNAVRLGLLGYFWSTLFPGSVGGDAVKAVYLCREQSRRTVAVATVLIDRAIGMWALFWFVAILGGAFWLAGDAQMTSKTKLQVIVLIAIGLVVFTSLMWMGLVLLPEQRADKFAGRLSRLPKVGGVACELWRAVWMYRSKQGSIVAAMLLALVGHVGWVLAFYFSAQAFVLPDRGADIPTLAEHYVIVPVGMIFQAVIPLPGGIGAGEFGFRELYRWVGSLPANGVVASLTQRFINWIMAAAGYVVYLWMPVPAAEGKEPETNDEEAPENVAAFTAQPQVSLD